jgi:hypothetical protein
MALRDGVKICAALEHVTMIEWIGDRVDESMAMHRREIMQKGREDEK